MEAKYEVNQEISVKKISFQQYMKNNFWLYVFLIPGIIYFAVFHYAPMYGIVMAFQKFNPIAGISGSPFVGLENFKVLFQSESFITVFKNSLYISVLRLIWGFPMPILLALMLNEIKYKRFAKVSQTVMYLPHFISWVVLSGIIINLLSPSTGMINYIVKLFGGDSIAFLQDPKYFRSILVISDIWKEAGWGTIVYIAAIAGIDSEMYEAARIDGASFMQKIGYITLPSIIPTITVLFILRLGSILKNGFEQIFMLYSPTVYGVADVFETYTYRIGLREGQFSFATAVGLFQSVVGLILVLATNKLAQKYGEGGLW